MASVCTSAIKVGRTPGRGEIVGYDSDQRLEASFHGSPDRLYVFKPMTKQNGHANLPKP
jgi:hypothetical protein